MIQLPRDPEPDVLGPFPDDGDVVPDLPTLAEPERRRSAPWDLGWLVVVAVLLGVGALVLH